MVKYRNLLEKVKSNIDTQSINTQEIYLIGDSHVLSYAHTVLKDKIIKPFLVMGAKMWHIGNQESNKYKTAYEHIVKPEIPNGSIVINSFGEIDCRVTEGIIPFLESNPNIDYEDHIPNMVAGYIVRLKSYYSEKQDIKLYLLGVPYPNVDSIVYKSDEQKEHHIKIIEAVNTELQDQCKLHKITFLDLYKLTKQNPNLFIDGYHLKSDVLKIALNEQE